MSQYDRFMPRGTPYARIAITLPEEDLAAADRLATDLDRSRSWVVAEAVRHYVADQSRVPDLDASRREQLRRDLALTPLDRIRAAAEGVQIVAQAATGPIAEPLRFASYDDFLAWSRTRERTQ